MGRGPWAERRAFGAEAPKARRNGRPDADSQMRAAPCLILTPKAQPTGGQLESDFGMPPVGCASPSAHLRPTRVRDLHV